VDVSPVLLAFGAQQLDHLQRFVPVLYITDECYELFVGLTVQMRPQIGFLILRYISLTILVQAFLLRILYKLLLALVQVNKLPILFNLVHYEVCKSKVRT